MIGAYVFIECANDPADIVLAASRLEGVKQVHALFGPLEAIAYIEAKDITSLEFIVLQFHKIPGVKNTDTRVIRLLPTQKILEEKKKEKLEEKEKEEKE